MDMINDGIKLRSWAREGMKDRRERKIVIRATTAGEQGMKRIVVASQDSVI